jgi:phenylacetate-CoA ligase
MLKRFAEALIAGRSEPAIAVRQATRLAELLRFARARSPFYRDRYRDLPEEVRCLDDVPALTKPELMAHFNAWVTDPAVTRAGVEDFLSQPSRTGDLYLGRYAAWTTSGSTGLPGIFVHDRDALAVYGALIGARGFARWIGLKEIGRLLRTGIRAAVVLATGGPFAGAGMAELSRRRGRRLGWRIRCFSVADPLADLARELQAYRPSILVGYATALSLLAEVQCAGRLNIRPILMVTAGEWLAPAARRRMETTFGCPVRSLYGATECMAIAGECEHGWLHLNADWVILEPVDDQNRPVPPGTASSSALLTNLANRVQPIIRYNLGDSITLPAQPCPCGLPLPAMSLEGRRDEILYLRGTSGAAVPILPMAAAAVVEETPGVERYQILQVAADALRIRLQEAPDGDRSEVWRAVAGRLSDYLARQGLAPVRLELDAQRPCRDPETGKFRQVWRAIEAGRAGDAER